MVPRWVERALPDAAVSGRGGRDGDAGELDQRGRTGSRDCAGNLYVTTGQTVAVLNAAGAVIGNLQLPAQVTNVAFGGPARKTLFITTLGNAPRLYRAELNVPGYPY
ncbi:MAG: SMP-30/gluconolactonase/LRE family protein [Polyangiaceae bacterium]